MTNISQLERQWKSYKRKQQRPYILSIIALLVLILLIVTITLFSDEPKVATHPDETKKTVTVLPATKQKQNDPSIQEETHITKKSSIQELRPSFDFMKQIKEKPYQSNHVRTRKKEDTPKRDLKHNVEPPKTYTEKRETKHNIAVSSTSADTKISSLVKRFNNSRNPILGITIAKQYLKNKKYKQAYFYALEVNNIDRQNEESWLITAKALYFLNKKESALKLLQSYLKNSNSSQAVKLYRAIKQDRLK